MRKQTTALKKFPSRYKVLECIYEYEQANGWAPTIRELCTLTGVKSSSTIWNHIRLLQDDGFIVKPADGSARAIRITPRGLMQLGVE